MSAKDQNAVLIVDDDEELRGLVAFSCRQMGFQAHTVESAEQAREWLGRNKPSLVIIDIMMPGGNGLELCQWIRAQPGLETLPIIVNSGLKDDETVQDALELGAVDFLHKPFAMAALQEKIKRARIGQ
ncbi:MAG: response regulator [Elusimicrobia bacterium]|nr:response regulator [Elusimicrobiota bacterium]